MRELFLRGILVSKCMKFLISLWSAGTEGQGRRQVRQILLVNQLALFCILVTILYEVFYLIHDPLEYILLLLSNIVFLGFYAFVLYLNSIGRFSSSRGIMLVSVSLQLFVVTMFLGTEAGVHLFYIPIGACMSFMFPDYRKSVVFFLMTMPALLYLSCYYLFSRGGGLLELSVDILEFIHAGSVIGAVFLVGSFFYLFQWQIERVEQDLSRSNDELERLSGLDPLTGLANRRALDACIDREWQRLNRYGLPLSLIMIDVDHFKIYNDHYGHLAGDTSLQQIAEALDTLIGRGGDLVARYGGEEFLILLPDTGRDGADHVAECARHAVMELQIPHAMSPAAETMTISVGVACATPKEVTDPLTLLNRADQALYQAKQEGRNRVVHWLPDMCAG